MIKGGFGGANTQTGIRFEMHIDLVSFLQNMNGYNCVAKPLNKQKQTMGYDIYFLNKLVAQSFKKHELYRNLEELKIDWRKILSKKLLPDDAIFVISNNTIFILEIKYQEVAGSVDEKLQTCGFKLWQYKKLFAPLNHKVEFIYILNDWFKKPEYKDTLDYILSVNCWYCFEYLPLNEIGLPML
ncbi:hypothetical protein [Helicobacter cetorum]|uniref:Uncharacterized protein n=1 Tax=Helicobacter cetorum (strain ATCC BAA-540 / CCUG 52418 / MIT 99-5656) TaxID=1163745 RepID=I0EUT1_HELCM|nr:hypothetical protein [Helicobacter cetorum]AFI06700.1 hypothetical protein HCD_08600 [Helicobacter cetorum MIT 99-5656]